MKHVFTTILLLALVGMLCAGTIWGADAKRNHDLIRSMTPAERVTAMNTARAQSVQASMTKATLAATVYVNASWAGFSGDPDGVSGPATQMGVDAFATIQEGIDAVNAGGTVNVYPGAYSETAANRYLYDAVGPYQFGLFVGATKAGVTIRGVDGSGAPIANAANAVAVVATNATNSFGYSGIFVEADNVTIQGLKIVDNVPSNNKTIEVIGDNVTIRNCWAAISDGGSFYINDWRYDAVGGVSYVKSYAVEGNLMENGTSVDLASGAGKSGAAASRVIRNNTFNVPTGTYWALISFSGTVPDIGWYLYPVGGAVITGNTFNGGEQHIIRARGTYDNTQFDWATYWNNNTYSRKVAFGSNPPAVPGVFSYLSGTATMPNVRHIAGLIQPDLEYAQAGDKVVLGEGAYEEQLEITKNLTVTGAGVTTIIRSPVTLPKSFTTSAANFPIVYVHDAATVALRNLTVDGAGRGNTNYRFVGVGFNNAGGSVENSLIKDVRETPINGNQHGNGLLVYAAAGTPRTFTLSATTITGFQKNAAVLSGANLTANVTGNTITGAGAIDFTAQNGIQVSSGTTADVTDNTVTGFSYTPGSWTSTGILLYDAPLVNASRNTVTGCQSGIYYFNAGGTIAENTVSMSAAAAGTTGLWAIVADPGASPRLHVQPYDAVTPLAGKAQKTAQPLQGTNALAFTIQRNTVTGDGTNGVGIGCYALGTEVMTATLTGNKVNGWALGAEYYKAAGATLTVIAHANDLSGNVKAIDDQYTGITQDASDNWFGGDPVALVTPNIDYTPYLGSGVDADPVTPGFQPANLILNVTTACPQSGLVSRLKEAFDLAAAGAKVNLAAGTYSSNSQTLSITKAMTVEGADQATTFIDVTGNGLGWGIEVASSDVTLRKFTVLPVTASGGYAIHASKSPAIIANVKLEYITINGSYRTAFDLNGVDNATVQYVTATNTTHGNGIQFSGCTNSIATHVTTANNVWGGIAIYCSKPADAARGSDNITVDRTTSSIGESNKLYVQDEFGYVNTNTHAIGFGATMKNGGVAGTGYTWYYVTVNEALVAAVAMPEPKKSVVESVPGGTFYVANLMSIQTAANASAVANTIIVFAGTYPEAVTITKDETVLRGADAATTIVNPGNTSLNALTVIAQKANISKFTFTGGRSGIVATTSNGRLMSLVVNGNAVDGIQLIDADNNLLQALTVSGQAAGAGIRLTGAQQNTVSGNTSSGNSINLLIEANGSRQASNNIIQGNTFLNPGVWSVKVTSQALTNPVNFNVFSTASTSDKYVANTDPALLNAEYNWFGGEVTPQLTDFSGNIDIAHNYATNPTIAIFPVTHYMPRNATVYVSVMAMVPNGVTVKGTDVNMSWDNDLAIGDNGDPIEGPFFSNAGNSFFEFIKPDGASMRVNQSVLDVPGVVGGAIPAMNVLFTQAFTSGPSDGTSHITLGTVQMRDQNNAPLTVNVDPLDHRATLIVDGTAPVVTVAIDNQTNTWTDLFLKNGDAIAVTATITDGNALGTGDITANLNGFYNGSGHAGDNPTSFVTTHATWPVVAAAVCNPANGEITVTVNATDMMGNVGTGTAKIKADNIKPTSLANFRATPGHKKVNLSWDNASGNDANFRGVKVQYAKWAGYPTYSVAAPGLPANETAGDGQAVLVTDAATTATHTFATDDRGIYYYRGFVVDMAGNYSDANSSDNDGDRSTNYFLGDLGSGPGTIGGSAYDGKVDFQDLSLFSYLYFSTSAAWPYPRANEADFGPTDNNKSFGTGSRFGIPHPSGTVEFEDLMIFSMNYNNVAPKIAVPIRSAKTQSFAVNLISGSPSGSTYDVTLHLGNDGRAVKGASVELSFDPSILKVSGVTRGDLFGTETQAFYGHRVAEGKVQIDAAVLGKDVEVEYSGDLATIHFTVLKNGDHAIKLENVTVRNATNAALAVEAGQTVVELPTIYDLAQNYPNPFNPSTTLKYQVPSPVAVEIVVYNVLGEKVVTLVNDVQQAGHYTVQWNGRDARNQTAPSGLYFYTMRAGEFSAVKKMMLMK